MPIHKVCNNCEYFEHHEKHPDREGFCDYHKDWFLPVGGCKHFKRIDAEEYDEKEVK